ncbi:MAG TPA: acyl-CoA dehydrogenase family protein [Mycobacteriales bacterium]|jgi:alkylation response protein AidB-like acyl-CoA dehydrogenase|nr:acyl-CoA dehydrogenase family protein [Mycobacteriales bacterium]
MNLTISDEQQAIVAAVAKLLADVGRDDPERLWHGAVELGWFGLGLPEELGGAGFGAVEEALVAKEVGRHAMPGPLVATVLAARVAAYSGSDELAKGFLCGSARAALAIPGAGDDVTLVDAGAATHVLVATPDLVSIHDVADCVGRQSLPSLDEASARESGTLTGEPLSSLPAAVDPVFRRGSLLTSAVLVGVAEACRDMSTDHARTREQFGSPIGAFQSIKHRCADMAVGAALADAQLVFAALSVAERRADAAEQVAALRVVATRTAIWNARETVQVHGGMGFTWECPAHLYLKRVHAQTGVFGTVREHERALLAHS